MCTCTSIIKYVDIHTSIIKYVDIHTSYHLSLIILSLFDSLESLEPEPFLMTKTLKSSVF